MNPRARSEQVLGIHSSSRWGGGEARWLGSRLSVTVRLWKRKFTI